MTMATKVSNFASPFQAKRATQSLNFFLATGEGKSIPSPLPVKVPIVVDHPGYTGPTTKVQRKAKAKAKSDKEKNEASVLKEQRQHQERQQQKLASQEQRRMIAWASQYGSMVAPGIAPALYAGQQPAAAQPQHGISQVYQRAVANWSQRRDDARSKVKEHASWLHGLGKDLKGFTGRATAPRGTPRTPSAFAKGVEAAEAARDAYKSWHSKYKKRAPEP